ncbi:MAG: FUSC family protein [Stellaceae bacterium]
MAIACLISYWIMTYALSEFVGTASDYLGGMWAAVATVFVFRDSRERSVSAGVARSIATCVSFALCLLYLCVFPFTPVGMAVLLGVGTAVMMVLDRRDDIVTTGITTAVVMVVAAMSARDPWLQPLLRLLDTVVGIAVGIGAKWIGAFLFYRHVGEPVR